LLVACGAGYWLSVFCGAGYWLFVGMMMTLRFESFVI